jgi:hypothetical protein
MPASADERALKLPVLFRYKTSSFSNCNRAFLFSSVIVASGALKRLRLTIFSPGQTFTGI